MNGSQQIVQKLWNYCSVLREDGLSYGDYVEQLTYLLFLKMAHERTEAPWGQPSIIPAEHAWPRLLAKDGDALEAQYRHTLEALGREPGMLGLIFRKAQNRIQDPAKLRRLVVDLIDRENWSTPDADVKGDAYEGLLGKKSPVRMVNEQGEEERQALTAVREDFWATTSNKQLAFRRGSSTRRG